MRLFLLTLIFYSASGWAAAAAKDQNRFTLNDWLFQKKKMRAMDLWLGFHKPNPYEFLAGGTYRAADTAGGFDAAWNVQAAAFAYFIGAAYQRERLTGTPRDYGLLQLRVFGYRQQSTNITIEGGMKHESREGVTIWNPLAGVSACLYFARPLGIEGLYRHGFAANEPALGGEISFNRVEGNVFLEFQFFRVFGGYTYQIEQRGSLPNETEKGFYGGLRIYL